MHIYRCPEAWHNCHNIGNAFVEEQLYVLGVKREYFCYFQKEIDKIRAKKKSLIKEYLDNPSDKKVKNKLLMECINEKYMNIITFYMYQHSFDILRNPKQYRKCDIYWWMERPEIFDGPEVQQFKLFPNVHHGTEMLTPVIMNSRFVKMGKTTISSLEEWETRY